jgi:hypothetical protein
VPDEFAPDVFVAAAGGIQIGIQSGDGGDVFKPEIDRAMTVGSMVSLVPRPYPQAQRHLESQYVCFCPQ